MEGLRWGSLFAYGFQLFQQHLWKTPSSIHWPVFIPLWKSLGHVCVLCFWIPCFVPLIYVSIQQPMPHYLNSVALSQILRSSGLTSPRVFFFFKIILVWLFSFLCLAIQFLESAYSYPQKIMLFWLELS